MSPRFVGVSVTRLDNVAGVESTGPESADAETLR